ncbi:MAG: GNAT family protein [Isosphaeraceae bacterium]
MRCPGSFWLRTSPSSAVSRSKPIRGNTTYRGPVMEVVGLRGDRIRLVPSEPGIHLDNAVRWFNDPEVTRFAAQITGVTRLAEERFFERMATSPESDLHWAILAEGLGHIGFVGLHQINWPLRSATGGILIGDRNAWGQGYASEAVQVRTRFAFDQLGLHRIEGHTVNPAMRRVYEKTGYSAEGIARQKLWREGRWNDVYLYAILESDDRTR